MSLVFILMQRFKHEVLDNMEEGEKISKAQIRAKLNITQYQLELLFKALEVETRQAEVGFVTVNYILTRKQQTKSYHPHIVIKK